MKEIIVLIYGYRGAPAGLAAVQKSLEKRHFDVRIAPIPPFGGTGELSEYTPDSFSDHLAAWLRQEKIKNPIMVGHSMGSIIVSAFAERHPELIAGKIVLLAPIAQKVPRPIAALTPLVTFLPNRLISYITTRYLLINKKGHAFFREICALSTKCGAECASKRADRAAAKFSASYAVQDFNFSQEVLFLAGERDRLNSQKAVKTLAATHGTTPVFLENSGHLLNYERPDAVAQAIADFIRG